MMCSKTMAHQDAEKGMAKRTLKHFCSSWEELRYDEVHNKPYFIGKREKDSVTEILFPVNSSKTFTFDELKSCIVDSGSTAVNLALYNSDSTVVLYKAELGLKPPIIFKENSTCSVLDHINVDLQLPGSAKKRKIETGLESPRSDQSESGSTSEYFQIDLNSSVDSDLSVVDNKYLKESNIYTEDN